MPIKCIFILQTFVNRNMKESNSYSRYNQNDQDSQSDFQTSNKVPKLLKKDSQNQNNYMRISNRNQKIDEEAILQDFNKKFDDQRGQDLNLPKVGKKKKIQKVSASPSKKHDFGMMKKKWKAEMDENIEKFKQHANEQKKGYSAKQKEYLLDFFKVLLDGFYQLKDHYQLFPDELTRNQKLIISPDRNFFLFSKELIYSFDAAFREAKTSGKIINTKDKWVPLINNLKDENNFELRRKILTKKIKPNDVIENNNEFLMSEEAKIEEQRQKKLILAQADLNLENLHAQSNQNSFSLDEQKPYSLQDQIQTLRSMPSNQNLEKRANLEREKLEEYKQSCGDEFPTRLKQRIQQVLKGTPSYDRIMGDFLSKFGNY